MATTILSVKDLTVSYNERSNGDNRINAVDGVNIKLNAKEKFCLVGESGSGKTSIALAVARLLPEKTKVGGSIHFNGTSIYNTSQSNLRDIRKDKLSFIFQDATGSLIPTITVGKQMSRVVAHRMNLSNKSNVNEQINELLLEVGLTNYESVKKSYPQQLSGGMCQRVMIALALCVEPSLVIADEPTSALDVLTQEKILDLIIELQNKYHFALFYITHDMRIALHYSDKVGVMKKGNLIDVQKTAEFISNPSNEYTAQLLESAKLLSI